MLSLVIDYYHSINHRYPLNNFSNTVHLYFIKKVTIGSF